MGANDNDVEAAHIDEILEAIEEYLDSEKNPKTQRDLKKKAS